MSKTDWVYEVKGIGDAGGSGNLNNLTPTEALKKLTKIVAKHSYKVVEVNITEKPRSKPSVVSG
jgi:hypothetical protein